MVCIIAYYVIITCESMGGFWFFAVYLGIFYGLQVRRIELAFTDIA